MDLKGKLIDVNLIPFDLEFFKNNSFRKLFFNKIHNGKKYYLKDNVETNRWELWSLKVHERDSALEN
jgi:hypothetical protein